MTLLTANQSSSVSKSNKIRVMFKSKFCTGQTGRAVEKGLRSMPFGVVDSPCRECFVGTRKRIVVRGSGLSYCR
jgi:hypothetical protein